MIQSTLDSSLSPVIEINNLGRRFAQKQALDNITLAIPRGCVFGLIGANGAGKTTLLRHILGMHYAQTGSVRVFGYDPVAHPAEVLRRIGYMSENRELPNWMRVGDLIQYTSSFYQGWDATYAEELRRMFDLDLKARVRNLSRGQRARACLLVALAHRPELLVLDEPSSGLDPAVRRDILGAIIRTIADDGRTVLFSSHLLDEVERVADTVAIMHHGRIQLCGDLDQIKESHRRVTIRFSERHLSQPALANTLNCSGADHEWTYFCLGNLQEVRQSAVALGAEIVEESHLTLDELFMASISRQNTASLDASGVTSR
jgi:ABC-2 type transport system ATP-binding protein